MKEGSCKHYNGNVYRGGECDAGINVRALVGGDNHGWLRRHPCFKRHDTEITCGLYCEPTVEDLAEYERKHNEMMDQFLLTLPLIKEAKAELKDGGQVAKKCPVCGGELLINISSYNRHSAGKCETDNCLSWIE